MSVDGSLSEVLLENRMDELFAQLSFLYGAQNAPRLMERIRLIIDRHHKNIRPGEAKLTERDAILIVYPDQVREPETTPLKTLKVFCERRLKGLFSGLHILPFFHYSSDDGFSVMDYREVNSELGDWDDIRHLGDDFSLMFDAVVNHISAQSAWFQAFLRNEPPYREYFITVEGEPDLSAVVRPRALPLLTSFETVSGTKQVWTMFSRDQVDLNYRNPEVLLEMIDIILFYTSQGAQFIRLDAIAFLWKEIGTSCVHLPQTHCLVQLLRGVLDIAAPHVMLITETNVPHHLNVSYFGDGNNEARMVYNFALPPLVLHAFHRGQVGPLAKWLADVNVPSANVSFLNFLASHDGIGLSAVRGILPESEIDWLINRSMECGGFVSYKEDRDGKQAYELNVNFFDALCASGASEMQNLQMERFVAAHAIMLSIRGVPAIYFHSMFGSRGWLGGVEETGQNRAINRQKLDLGSLERDLADPASLRHQVFGQLSHLLKIRSSCSAFHPAGPQTILKGGDSVLAMLRESPTGDERVLCLQNVSGKPGSIECDLRAIFEDVQQSGQVYDLISNQELPIQRNVKLTLRPYQTLWLSSA